MGNVIKRVLLVEKNETYAEQIQQAFSHSGHHYDISTAKNLKEARALKNDFLPDIIISDLILPDGQGTLLFNQDEQALRIPVIILVDKEDILDLIDSGKFDELEYVFISEVSLNNIPRTVERTFREHDLISRAKELEKSIDYRKKCVEAISLACEYVISSDGSNFDQTLAICCNLLNVDRGFIIQILNEGDEIQVISKWHNEYNEQGFDLDYQIADELSQWVMKEVRQKDYIAISNTSEYLFRRNEEREFVESLTDHSLLILPIRFQSGNFSGFIGFIDNTKQNKWWREDVRMMNVVAKMIGLYWDKQISLEMLGNAKTDLLQSQKMEAMGRLASGVIHDFNNLLTVITGNSEIAMMVMDDDNPLYDNFKEISGAAQRAAGLTRQLLSFSRKKPFEPKIINLNDIIKNMMKMFHRIIGDQVVLNTVLDDSLTNIKADPGQIEQAIVNLVVNARDAMSNGGNLLIETSSIVIDDDFISKHPGAKSGQKVKMAVSDTGVGMSSKTISKIFDPFFTTKDLNKGTGLGLSTVYGIVKQYDGYIGVESELGKGTKFNIYLPSVQEAADDEMISKRYKNLPLGSESVLVIEDEDSVRAYVCAILKKHGYTVIKSSSGEDALQLCDNLEKPVDLVIADVVLPIMNGQDFVFKLAERWTDFKLLYMTGYTISDLISEGKLDSDTPCLHKPFDPVDLLLKVREVLDE